MSHVVLEKQDLCLAMESHFFMGFALFLLRFIVVTRGRSLGVVAEPFQLVNFVI